MTRSALLLPLLLALGTYCLLPRKSIPTGHALHGSAVSWEMPVARPAGLGPERAVFRYSVIAGGAYSVSELERAERRDPVVAAHYARFDHANLRMAQNPAVRPVYVSYRVGDAVYWTRGRVQLPAAETLITDGKNEARARCGNQVSDTPRQPTLARQAPLASLDETERVLSATASAVAGQSAPLLAQEIFPAPAPLQMALGGVSVSGRSSDSEGGIGGGFEGGFAAWGGGGYGGLAPWQSVAAQVPGGQIPVPRIPDQSLPQTVPVVWVASSETAFLTPGLITSASTVSTGESALPTSPPAPASSSFLSAVPSGGGGSVMAPPELPASTSGSGTETPSGGGGDSGPPPTGDSPTTPPVSDTPTDTPEPGTGLLAAAGALAVAGLAAFRRRRQRAS